jgi:hypothetical protein
LAGPIRLGKEGLLVQTASGRLSLLRP